MSDILDPSALLSSFSRLLPVSCILKSPQDALVALIHASMTAVLFRLVGTDDTSSITAHESNRLPENWNAYGPGHYVLRYKHEQSSLEFVVKVSKLAARTIVNAIAVESDKAASLDVRTSDYTSPSFFPHDPSEVGAQPLVHGFISSNRITDFVQSYKINVIQKLVPGLSKEGPIETTETASAASSMQGGQRQPHPPPPRASSPPYAGQNPFGNHPSHIPSGNPLSIGRRDLDPLPTHPNPFGPPPLFNPLGGDGMYVGRDHPIFSDRFTPGRGRGIGGREGPWGGDGFLPPMGAPPGARFDPVGPFGSPFGQGPGRGGPFGGPRGLGGPPGSGSAPPNPDNDEFMPPGAGDMYS